MHSQVRNSDASLGVDLGTSSVKVVAVDAKLRRQSVQPGELFLAHIGGMDMLAQTLLNAATVVERGRIESFRDER